MLFEKDHKGKRNPLPEVPSLLEGEDGAGIRGLCDGRGVERRTL